jgi:predicted transposase/invertase (TIGR01784 family)
MKHQIDPKIDCVFKRLLGSEDNQNLLVHFLNAVLSSELKQPITSVLILNPYNDKEHIDDKLSIVDVKARDRQDQLYQMEIQLACYASLPVRVIYTWADVYSQQLQSGNKYSELKPTYSIWLLDENIVKDDDKYLHRYKFRDDSGQALTGHGGIWLLELKKFHTQHINNEQERWLQFFKDGNTFNDDKELPVWMQTQEMRQAMNTLRQFSEKEKNYFAYQARQDFIRQQNTIQFEYESALQELQEAREREQQALAEKKEALAEKNEALAEKNEALAEKDAANQREQQALIEKEAALLELANLKALLANM